ncbi:MAG: phosphonoacetaldehyde hydrolase [Lentisphaeria bacterium]
MFKLIIADLAGTTVDHGSKAPAGAFIDVFKKFHINVSENHARKPMGLHKRDHIRCMLQEPEVAQEFLKQYNRPHNDEDIEQIFQAFLPIQLACLPNYCTLIPGALETFAFLRSRNIKIANTTGYNCQMTQMVLNATKAQGFTPDFAICAEEVPQGRPAPWMIYQSMQNLNITSIDQVLKIGDSISDIQAGINAGCYTVGVVSSGNMLGLSQEEIASMPQEKFDKIYLEAENAMLQAGAHAVIPSIKDLPELIIHLENS